MTTPHFEHQDDELEALLTKYARDPEAMLAEVPDEVGQAAARAAMQVILAHKRGLQPMKDMSEVKRANDILLAFLLAEVPVYLTKDMWGPLHSAADTLGWVLNHEHGENFADNLAQLERLAEQAGYQIVQRKPKAP